tara:strand:+ start:412 stop:558 length:147 start_codon:yes stop_codon:yes gene_type:complete
MDLKLLLEQVEFKVEQVEPIQVVVVVEQVTLKHQVFNPHQKVEMVDQE